MIDIEDLTFSLLQNKKHAHKRYLITHTYTQTKGICEEILYTIKALSGTQIYTPVYNSCFIFLHIFFTLLSLSLSRPLSNFFYIFSHI